MVSTPARAFLVVPLLALAACAPDSAERLPPQDVAEADSDPQRIWWDRMQQLCGQAFGGEMVNFDPETDSGWLDRPVVMHVRECTDDEIRIPLHVGEDRSRTWVLTRTDAGIQLKHDHRHADGSEDESTQYGGDTAGRGRDFRQEFPADDYSRDLFLSQNHPDGVHNVWAMEVHPGDRFTYHLTRFNRDFRADFDLSTPVSAPPPPWAIQPER
jgi:hypothetical protein